jgi:hypothetical protein
VNLRGGLAAVGAALVIALASLPARAEDSPPATTVTVTVERTVQGKTVDWWSRHAVQARKDANARAGTIVRLRRRWRPTVEYALRLASRAFTVPYRALRAVARCESTFNPFAVNGPYKGLLQLSWSPFGFSPFDPVASALSTAAVVRREGWRRWECRP